MTAQIDALVAGGKLRIGAEQHGFASEIVVWSDRVCIYGQEPEFHVLDGHVRASVETAGQLTESARPTLPRMAVGSVLPGSALLVGLALPKKQVHDSRELYSSSNIPNGSGSHRSTRTTRAGSVSRLPE